MWPKPIPRRWIWATSASSTSGESGSLPAGGTPGHLLTLGDLAREGIQVLDVQPEEMQEFQDKVPGLRGRLAASVRTGEDGIRAWRAKPELDARAASSETDFTALPDDIGAVLPPVRRQ